MEVFSCAQFQLPRGETSDLRRDIYKQTVYFTLIYVFFDAFKGRVSLVKVQMGNTTFRNFFRTAQLLRRFFIILSLAEVESYYIVPRMSVGVFHMALPTPYLQTAAEEIADA